MLSFMRQWFQGNTTRGPVLRLTYGTAHRLGWATGIAHEGCCSVGRRIGRLPKMLTCPSWAVIRRTGKGESQTASERIRSIVIEEVARLLGAERGSTLPDLEERLRLMTEAIEALQERINTLGMHGPVSEASMREELGSLDAAQSLTEGEKVILVNVFRRNMALQKPELADAPVRDGEAAALWGDPT